MLFLDDPGVRLVGDLGQDQEVIDGEGVGRLPIVVGGLIAARQGQVVPGTAVAAVLPDRGLDPRDPDPMHWLVAGGWTRFLLGRGFVVMHFCSPFSDVDLASSPSAEE